jgi:hypothetical protein
MCTTDVHDVRGPDPALACGLAPAVAADGPGEAGWFRATGRTLGACRRAADVAAGVFPPQAVRIVTAAAATAAADQSRRL